MGKEFQARKEVIDLKSQNWEVMGTAITHGLEVSRNERKGQIAKSRGGLGSTGMA